jgi:hypothetical protein
MKNIKLNNILSNILSENAKVDALVDKYTKPQKNQKDERGNPKSLMGVEVLAQIIFADPTTKKPEGIDTSDLSLENLEKVQPGQYINWMLERFANPEVDESGNIGRARELFIEDLYQLTGDLAKFTKVKQYLPVDKRDIGKYTSPNDLFTFLNNFELPERIKEKLKKNEFKKEVRKEREGFKHPGAKVDYVGDKYTVIKIEGDNELSREAAAWYGGHNKETRWCTSTKDSRNFTRYIEDGPLYVILPNDDNGKVGELTGLPEDRYQFHFQSDQYMDRFDHSINLVEFLNDKASDLKEYFKPQFAKDLVTKGNKVDITYPNSSAGKYIALYGFEELIEGLPDNITEFGFVNKSSQKIAWDIPASIGRFKQLNMLQLDGVVKSLPDEIGGLTNLFMLALSNNPQLKSLPSSIGKLKGLVVMNLMGCDSNLFKTLPEEVQKQFGTESNADFLYVHNTN